MEKMADDPNLRQNRLNLLGLLRNHARVLADFGAIVKTQGLLGPRLDKTERC
jgi:hypothetical protein